MTELSNNTTATTVETAKGPLGVAILDLRDESPDKGVIKIDEIIVIDARDKSLPNRVKGWTNRSELKRWGSVVEAVRNVIASSLYYRDISKKDMLRYARLNFIQTMYTLGYPEVKNARVVGNIPSWWEPIGPGKSFVLKAENWTQKKYQLDTLEREINTTGK